MYSGINHLLLFYKTLVSSYLYHLVQANMNHEKQANFRTHESCLTDTGVILSNNQTLLAYKWYPFILELFTHLYTSNCLKLFTLQHETENRGSAYQSLVFLWLLHVSPMGNDRMWMQSQNLHNGYKALTTYTISLSSFLMLSMYGFYLK